MSTNYFLAAKTLLSQKKTDIVKQREKHFQRLGVSVETESIILHTAAKTTT